MDPEYFGQNITRDDCWLLELANIDEELRIEESSLLTTRWFDYRHMLPAQATYLFAHLYDQVYREFYAMQRDYRDAERIKVLRTQDVFKSSDLVAFWRARQAADRLGCRYDFFLRFAFKQCHERGWNYLPRPNQLYGEALCLDCADAWAELKQASLQLAKHARFKVENFTGHPDQLAYQEYLIEQVKAREHAHHALNRLIVREGVLTAEVASSHFDPDVLKRALV